MKNNLKRESVYLPPLRKKIELNTYWEQEAKKQRFDASYKSYLL
ncbi:hypothetical protein CCAND95_290016 [Capnocytophaga canis]|uniref:Uncharacterized protein n=1 Tax=Capnocytophaga canis TaxID=1848903 RepID=A0A0B7I3M4_9FLAO|nr:hypothetical protein CCAND95_290016 [Capnocytophaga canis]CEN46245.1 hypothetical protein CCAND38_330007 [Capnocytophaga canis]CEN53899.1 hypothetical protein CCAND93_620015 [Capnocytophaga canis]